MNLSLNTLTLPVLFSIIWWVWYFTGMLRVVRYGHLRRMPRLYFWLLAYCVGLLYYLHNNELEQQLQTYFAATGLPVMSLIRLLVSSGLVTYSYIVVIRRYTSFRIPAAIDGMMGVFIALSVVVNLALYRRIPYLQLQLITGVLIGVTTLFAAFSLLPMMRQVLHSRQSPIRALHHRWTIIFLTISSCAVVLVLVDAIHKLLTGWWVIYSPLYVLALCCQAIYMLAIAVLIGPDRYLYWIEYPRRWRMRRRLQRVVDGILREIQSHPVYDTPVPAIPTPGVLDFAIYRLFILIMDNYPFLPQESPLRHRLVTIERLNAPYEETLEQLQTLGQEL